MEQLKYDVVIVGAGPAGIFTALKLNDKRPDLKVLIVDMGKDISSRINKYDNLIEEARRNARNHIERIAYSMCGNSFSHSVKFSSESGGENNE